MWMVELSIGVGNVNTVMGPVERKVVLNGFVVQPVMVQGKKDNVVIDVVEQVQ